MENIKFYSPVINHLIAYKECILGVLDNGLYYNCNLKKHVEYAHILPECILMNNYMCDEAILESEKIKKHENWYHLNSSQTLCINVFVMLIIDDYYYLSKLLSNVLGFSIRIVKHEFERVETKGSTNFDFYCEDDKGHKYYFEIKYTEKDIAKKTGASNPKATFDEKYRTLIENGSYLKWCLQEDNWKVFMFNHYQAYRNIVMANENKGDYVFFITMRHNPGTYNELLSAIRDTNEKLNNVKSLYWEDLIETVLKLVNDNPELSEYYKKVKQKYFDIDYQC